MERALEEALDGQILLTDPDARAMPTSARYSGLVGYSAQAAVDTATHWCATVQRSNSCDQATKPCRFCALTPSQYVLVSSVRAQGGLDFE